MTAPFGPVLESALKENVQGGRLSAYKGLQVRPQFFCCISGTSVGVAKDPVAVLFLSADRVCMNTAITADYSLSWSPSSTLQTWEIDWGDGSPPSSGGPPWVPGSVAHPGGGYALDITYTITLTVTDLAGGSGFAQIQIEVIDCTVAVIDVFAGCGDSGPWKSADGGLNWGDVGYGVLDGVKIHDIKANWFTIGTESVEVWTATEDGVYMSVAGSVWARKALPAPIGYLVEPLPVAITCSKYDPLEVYVLATSGADVSWLYRTVDAGVSWTYMAVGPIGMSEPGGGIGGGGVWSLHWDASVDFMYSGGWAGFPTVPEASNGAGYWNGAAWAAVGGGVNSRPRAVDEDNLGNIWYCGSFTTCEGAPCNGVASWSGFAWTDRLLPPAFAGVKYDLEMYNGDMYVTGSPTVPTGGVYSYSGGVWTNEGDANRGGIALHATSSYLYYGGGSTIIDGVTACRIARWNGVSWTALGDGVGSSDIADYDWVRAIASNADGTEIYVGGDFLTAGGETAYNFAMWDEVAHVWSSPSRGLELLNGEVHAIVVSEAGDVYIGGEFSVAVGSATILNYIARWNRTDDTWAPVGSGFNGYVRALEFDEDGNLWVGGDFTQDGNDNAMAHVAVISVGDATPAIVGRTHLLDMSADGQCVYIGLLDDGDKPAIIRVGYELNEMTTIHHPGIGTWGGVAADPFYSNILWMYGDFAGENVLFSDNWGLGSEDRTNELPAVLIRPLLISAWDSRDVIAIANGGTLESWRTKDFGIVWAEQGDTAFICDCGVRDHFEPENIWIGRVDSGGAPIRYSPNAGVGWIERWAGFPSPAIVTALQVTK